MKPRSTLVTLALTAAACSLGGSTISLGGGELANANAGNSGRVTAGSSGLEVGDAATNLPCTGGQKTSVSGTVYDPKGRTPLYNAVVYVPDGPLPDFIDQVGCEKCTDPVPAQARALSDATGHFLLEDVPAGAIDLVVQMGKWRRKQTIVVPPCVETKLTDHNLTRLPQNRSEGHIPKIALSTGHSDALECLLLKIGIDASEFTTDADNGRVHLFVGCSADNAPQHFGANQFVGGQLFPSTTRLFDSGTLSSYDMVIFSCEGHKCDAIQTSTNVARLTEYANSGGRVFLGHTHYNWINHATDPIQKAAHFHAEDDLSSPVTTKIYTSREAQAQGGSVGFPKGDAFALWLTAVQASSTADELAIYGAQRSCTSLDPNRAQRWIYLPETASAPEGNLYLTIGTPVAKVDDTPAPEACGRVVFTDLHVSSSSASSTGSGGTSGAANAPTDFSDELTPFPLGCVTTDLTPQEKALEFMIFDLSSCVQKETAVPTPPPPAR